MRFCAAGAAGFWDPARAAARGSSDRPRPEIPSAARAVRCSVAAARRLGPRDGVHVEVFAANRVVIVAAGDRDSAAADVLGGADLGRRLLRRSRHARADRRRAHAPRITASVCRRCSARGAQPLSSRAAGRFLGIGGRAGRGVRRRTTLAWFARRRAAVEARGDRARGRPVRPPADRSYTFRPAVDHSRSRRVRAIVIHAARIPVRAPARKRLQNAKHHRPGRLVDGRDQSGGSFPGRCEITEQPAGTGATS